MIEGMIMKLKTTLWFGLGLCATILAACSSNDHPNASLPPVAIPQTPQALDTAQVLTLAQKTSETGSPFAVNGGLITLSDTSETSSPITVDATM
jgi:hypothetical protein